MANEPTEVRYPYGVKPAKLVLSALMFAVAAVAGVLLARRNEGASAFLYALSALSALFVVGATAIVFRAVGGSKDLIIAGDHFVVPAALLRRERRVLYVDVKLIREGRLNDVRTLEVFAFGKWCGMSERSFERSEDYERAIDLIKRQIERR